MPNFQSLVATFRVGLDLMGVVVGHAAGLLLWNGIGAEFVVADRFPWIVVVSLAVMVLVAGMFDLYDPKRSFLDIEENSQLLRAVLVTAAATRLFLFLARIQVDAHLYALDWACTLVVLYFLRRSFHLLGENLRLRGIAERSAFIYGAGETGRKLARQLGRVPELGVHVIGFLDDRPDYQGHEVDGIPVLGDFLALEGLLARRIARCVYIALPQVPRRTVLDILEVCRRHGIPFHIVPSIPELFLPWIELQEIDGIPLLGPGPAWIGPWGKARRRILDLVFAIPLAEITFLLQPIIEWCLKGKGVGPVYTHRRVAGRAGKLVSLKRFRTEYPSGGRRVLGRILRYFRLDSLPLAWPLLRGEISLIGARPMSPKEAANLEWGERFRLELPPGLSGLWRIASLEGEDSDDLEADLQYVRHQSLLLDLSILLRTLDVPGRGFARD